MVHTESTRPSSCTSQGRAGRSPSMILNITDGEFNPVNGCLPVKTYDRIWISGKYLPSTPDNRRGEIQERTSITTIPKEKMSASRVTLPPPLRISGAVHLAVYPCAWDTRSELTPRTIEASPKSVKQARPLRSTRILGYPGVSGVA